MRISMWQKKNQWELLLVLVLGLIPVGFITSIDESIPWFFLLVLLFGCGCTYFIRKSAFFAEQAENNEVILRESYFSKKFTVEKNTIEKVEIYKVDEEPIGLQITQMDGEILTFSPSNVSPNLLNKVKEVLLR